MQYLSIPIENKADILVGQGLGSYVQALAQKSPGLFHWQLQPIHNGYILAIFEVGLLPLLATIAYVGQKIYTKIRRYQPVTTLQIFIIGVAIGLAALFAIDHYMWDIEQGQLLAVLLITVLIFSFQSAIPKS